jgi:hypothetical protein
MNKNKQTLTAVKLRHTLQDIDDSEMTRYELSSVAALNRWANRIIREADEDGRV